MVGKCNCDIDYGSNFKGHVSNCKFFKDWIIASFEELQSKTHICQNVVCFNFRRECEACRPDYAGLIELIKNK